jgi:3-hydroxyacyl-CoA dehydrogenase
VASVGVDDRDLASGGKARILCLTAPPMNALTAALRTALGAALTAALADPAVQAIVLMGAGAAFSTGLAAQDMGQPQAGPSVAELAAMIAGAAKPVVAALHGLTLSAAAELALAAQARVAGPDLRLGLRAARFGQLPDAGGTQRLPQLVGAGVAIRLLRDGAMVTAHEAVTMGLVDRVVTGDLVAAAMALAAQMPARRMPGLRQAGAYQAAVAAARPGADALTLRMLDCVAAAQVLPLDQGLMFEAAAAADMAATPQAKGLRHAMLADLQMASVAPGGAVVRHLGLWGAATARLALPAMRAGIQVTVADADRAALIAALEKLALLQEADVQAHRLTPVAREAEWARLTPAVSVPDHADLVIAALPGGGSGAVRWGPADAASPGVILAGHGVAEVQLHSADQAAGATLAATLRRMGWRVMATRPAAKGVIAALKAAAMQALQAMAAQGVAGAALTAGVPAWLRLDVPQSAGHVVVDPAQVEARVMGALVAEGARLLAGGAVRVAMDIDALALGGLQMPRTLGGPMFQADQRGLLLVRRDLAVWAREDAVWQPAPLFDDLIAKGQGFGHWQG